MSDNVNKLGGGGDGGDNNEGGAGIPDVGLPLNLTPEEFRWFLVERVDDALGMSWLIRGDTRRILSGLRTYLPTMPAEELRRLMEVVPK